MKNILFISPTGTFDNGAEVSIFNLMVELKKTGNNVINVAPGNLYEKRKYYDHLAAYEIKTKFVSPIKWWWEDAPGTVFGSEEERFSSYRDTIKEISNIIKEYNVDLVISNTVNVYLGSLAAACESIPHFWLIHEFPKNEFSYYKEKIDFIQNFSHKIFSVEGRLTSELQQLMDKKISSFVPFSEVKIINLKNGKKTRIVSVGRISERKNQLELIKASKDILEDGTELVFIGDWDIEYKEKCDQFIKKNKIKSITFLGHKENPWEELTNKDICVFPSKNETFGLVYVEAILNGIPTIISDNDGHISAFKYFETGEIYSSGNVSQLEGKIKKVLANQQELSKELASKKQMLHNLYQPKICYDEIIKTINDDNVYQPNAIRHVKNLLMVNTKRSKLANLEYRIRLFLSKAIYKIKKKL